MQYRCSIGIGMTLQDMVKQLNQTRIKHRMAMNGRGYSNDTANRWRAGICSICGEYMTYISEDHAHKHGFANADEMAKAGVMRWAE